jgi:hypothetical protein
MNKTGIRPIHVLLGAFSVFGLAVTLFLFSRREEFRFSDPTGRYTAVVTTRRYQGFIMRFPGQGSDAAGFVEIFDRNGKSYGRVPVDILWFVHELEWTGTGAELISAGAAQWDFLHGTCYYWARDPQRQIWVKR